MLCITPFENAAVNDPRLLSGEPPTLLYTPDPNFEGMDTVAFEVRSGANVAQSDVTIHVHSGDETIPPEIVATSPISGAVGVAIYETPVYEGTCPPFVHILFSEPLDPATVNGDTLRVEDKNGTRLSGQVQFDATSNTVRFLPSEPLQMSMAYTGTVGAGIRDTSGNSLAEEYRWSFQANTAKSIYLPVICCGAR